MNRKEFMRRLEELLADISENEREEALQYYEDYFDDAGTEREAAVIEELVSPEQVARKIKAGLSEEDGEFSEEGYRDSRFEGRRQAPAEYAGAEKTAAEKPGRKQTNFWKVLAIILLCILLGPIVIPVGFVLLVAIFGVAIGILAVAFGIGVSGIALILGGMVTAVRGIVWLFRNPAGGILTIGAGCLLISLGILVSMLILWICRKVIPVLIQGMVNIVSWPFRKAGAKK